MNIPSNYTDHPFFCLQLLVFNIITHSVLPWFPLLVSCTITITRVLHISIDSPVLLLPFSMLSCSCLIWSFNVTIMTTAYLLPYSTINASYKGGNLFSSSGVCSRWRSLSWKWCAVSGPFLPLNKMRQTMARRKTKRPLIAHHIWRTDAVPGYMRGIESNTAAHAAEAKVDVHASWLKNPQPTRKASPINANATRGNCRPTTTCVCVCVVY